MKHITTVEGAEGGAPDPLAGIAAQAGAIDAQLAGATDLDVHDNAQAAQDEAQQAQALAAIEGVAVQLVATGLRIVRGIIVKRGLPELQDEWTDPMMTTAAGGAIPLLKKHLGRWMELAAESPELAALFVSLLPLAMGVVSAIDKHQRNVSEAKTRPLPSSHGPSAADPAPAG